MKGEIYLIGGGEIVKGETSNIDNALISSCPKGSRFVFFPTAAGDSEGYVHAIESVFGEHFEVISVTQNKGEEYARNAIESATVVYLGGGKTELLLQLFDVWQLVPILRNALQKGTHVAGMSAGAQALSAFYINNENNPISIERGWGLANVACLVHANEESATTAFEVCKKNVMSNTFPFVAIGEGAAWRINSEEMSKIGDSLVWHADGASIDILQVR